MKNWLRVGQWSGLTGITRIWLISSLMVLGCLAGCERTVVAQGVTTTTVQGTVYLADGTPGSGTLLVSWPAFTTTTNLAVAAGNSVVTIGSDGFVSVNLAPNAGANPAGLYYTSVFHLSDGTVNTEYWVVPAAATASLAQVRAQLMPAAQAVQTVSKAYVDEAIAELQASLLTASGGTLTGPLTLCCDPVTPLQAADKHYVDEVAAGGVGGTGGNFGGVVTAPSLNGVYSPLAGSPQATLQQTQAAAVTGAGSMQIPDTYAGTDTFTNTAGIRVEDLRTGVSQQHERSVKEFGAVCDGVTDDTAALQTAINFAQTQYAAGTPIALTLPAGVCKTHKLVWHLESIGGQGRQASGLKGFPGEDVLATVSDATNLLPNTRLHDLTIFVDQSLDVSCSPAEGRAAAGSCGVNRPMESNSVFAPGGNGLASTAGTGAGWSIGNCAIAMPATTGLGGNGFSRAEIENVAIATVGADPLAAYAQADSTHTCGIYLGQWPERSEFRNVDISGVGTGIAVPALPVAVPAGLVADSNRWMNVTVAAVHGFAMAAGANNVVDGMVLRPWNSAAAGDTPTGLVLDFGSAATPQQNWTVRNVLVQPEWVAVQPKLTITAAGGAVTAVAVGPEHGLGFDAYGTTAPLAFSGSCTAAGIAAVNGDGSISTVTITAGGVGCSGTTTATVSIVGTTTANGLPAKAVNLVSGANMTFLGGNLLKGNGGFTVWNAQGSRTSGTGLGGGGTLPASATPYPALVVGSGVGTGAYSGSANRFDGLGLATGTQGGLQDSGLGNTVVQASADGVAQVGIEPARSPAKTIAADFALLGGGTPAQAFPSLNDLFFSAEDLLSPTGESVGTGSLFGKDPAAPVTASYVKAVGGAWDTSGTWSLRGAAGSLVLGAGFPAGAGTWMVAARADAAATQELKLQGTTGTVSCTFADQTLSLTTSWQVFRIPYNTVTGISSCDSATTGNAVNAIGLTPVVSGGGTTNVSTAFMSFVPAFQQLLIANAPTTATQAANKAYVDGQIASQIVSGAGSLPITGGTLTGPLTAPAIDGTTDCGVTVAGGGTVAGCVAAVDTAGGSSLIPPGVTGIAAGGAYQQGAALQATAQCLYDETQGGAITAIMPGALGLGYTSAPSLTFSGGGGGGLAATAVVTSGQVTSYTVTNGGGGYTGCPSISVAAPPAAATPAPILDQRRGVTSYSADVRVDDFGCAADGVTDDTQCFNTAINYATQGGTRTGAITLTQGKVYYIATITGYMQTAYDDGTAPSTDTCGGVACTNLAPETPGYLGYAVKILGGQSNPLTIFGNGATILSSYSGGAETAATYTLAAPYFAVFGSDQTTNGFNLYDLNFSHAFIGAAVKSAAYWRWDRISMNTLGIAVLLGSSQYDSFRDLFIQNTTSGIIVGGWWGNRAPSTSVSGNLYLNIENLGDDTTLENVMYSVAEWPSQSQSQTVQNALDTWFNTWFFHVADNQTRLTDQNQANLGVVTDSMWRGIYHVMLATYSRYGRPVLGVTIKNANVKGNQNYPLIATAAGSWVVDGFGGEDVGYCDGNQAYGTYGSSSCPSPYDAVNNILPGAMLIYGFQNFVAKDVGMGGAVLESAAEPWQVSASQQLADFRANLSVFESSSGSSVAPRTPPVPTGRFILGLPNSSFAAGVSGADSSELCMKGYNVSFTDEWCMRAVDGLYPSGFTMPRYLTLENDGYSAFTGTTALQTPGLRVRPGLISASDGTLPVTDFSEQAFTIAAGSVLGQTCASVPGIALANAVTSDGVLFVKPPSATGALQLSGSVTAAGTMAMTACNPSTTALSYPAGTYYAFLLAGSPALTNPSVSGGAATATSPLTTSEGDLVVGDLSGNPSRLPGNTSTSQAVLVQTGTGTGANEPVWSTAPTFYGGNLTGINAGSISTGTVPIAAGGTGATTAVGALANLGGASLLAPASAFQGTLTAKELGGVFQVDQFAGADFGAKLTACIAGLSTAYGGVCDARNFTGTLAMGSTVTIATANTTVYLPCGTIASTNSIVIPAGIRNVTLRGCGLRGASAASGSQGGTVLLYSGSGPAVQIGDPTYAGDTLGFHLDDVVINTTGSSSAAATGVTAYRVQEMELASLYFLGNSNQIGLLLDGTGNYTGGTFYDLAFNGWQMAVSAIGHQVANPATTDWLNASTFVRLHIDCPTSGGSPITGVIGINLAQGDGNTFTGGDVEGCGIALHLGANAQNNTLVGVRNENSASQVTADTGSSYNSWITGGTMFTGALTDNGTRNSFLDTFHRAFNGLNGDWYGSQKDATITNHFRIGIGTGNERGMLDRYQTDFGYRWTMGLSDATAGEQFYQILDELNAVYRISIGQFNSGSTSTNAQTVINAAGTGAVVLNGSNNAGSGGVVFGSGGMTETTVATIDGAGDANFTGTMQVGGVTTARGSVTVKNQADTEIDSTLWAGLTATQKESFIYKDWNGNSQWYMVKDAGNNWALNSAVDLTDHFKAYQSGETMLNSNGTGYVSVNREAGSGSGGLVIFSGGASPTQVAKIDSAGNFTNTGTVVSSGISEVNAANTEADLVIQPGSTAEQNGALQLNSFGGTAQWKLKKDASNYFRLSDVVNSLDRVVVFQNGNTNLNAGAGANGVAINSSTGTGTGGLLVYSGGSTPAQVAKIDGSGNLTVTSCTGCGSGSTSTTGTGAQVLATSPTIVTATLTSPTMTTPSLGAASAASLAVTGASTFTGATTHVGSVTLANGVNAAQTLAIQPGSTADQNGTLQFSNFSGTSQWTVKKDSSNGLRVTDSVNALDRAIWFAGGATLLNSAGSSAVLVNNTSGSGTGGLIVYGGGTAFATAELTVTGSGNLTANGFVAGKYVLNGASQTTVSCSGSGSVVFSEPEQGASYKKIVAYENACAGTATYTYPTAFVHMPQVLSQNLTATATSVSTSGVTVTGSSSTGFLDLDGY